MMKKTFLATAGVGLMLVASAAMAGSAGILLQAGGTINKAPEWQDSVGAKITAVTFDFNGQIAAAAATNRDSFTQTFKLANAVSYPASVALVRPTDCTIGATTVDDADVHIVQDGTAITTDTAVDVALGNMVYALRFAAAGNYGDKDGLVACTAGSMTYSY